jgi:hypothetical protein
VRRRSKFKHRHPVTGADTKTKEREMRGILQIRQKRLTHRRLLYVFDWVVIVVSALIGGMLVERIIA